MWPFKSKPPEPKVIKYVPYRPAMTKDEAAAKGAFYESMFHDVSWQNMQKHGTSPAPWECVMYYVGALEERVKALESEKGA